MTTYNVGEAPWEKGQQEYAVGSAPWETNQTTPSSLSSQQQEEQRGFLESIARPFLKVPASLTSGVVSMFDQQKGQQYRTEGVDFGPFGKVKPFGSSLADSTKSYTDRVLGEVKDVVGTGLELASYAPIGTSAKIGYGAVKNLVAPSIKTLMKEGAISGVLSGSGTAMQDDKNILQIAGESISGGAFGTLVGGGFGLGGKAISGTAHGVRNLYQYFGGKLDNTIENKKLFRQTLEESTKALSPGGKMSGKGMEVADSMRVKAMNVLATMGKEIDVIDSDGLVKKFDPATANFSESLQALVKLKNQLYTSYSSTISELGEKGAKINKAPMIEYLTKATTGPRMGEVKNRANQLLKEVTKLSDNPEDVLTYLQDLNAGLTSQILGKSESISHSIDIDLAKKMRTALEEVIDNVDIPEYKGAREAYGALRSIENDMVRQAQQQARRVGGGLSDYVDAFSIPEVLVGVISANPVQATMGTTRLIFTTLMKLAKDRERNLRNALQTGSKIRSLTD